MPPANGSKPDGVCAISTALIPQRASSDEIVACRSVMILSVIGLSEVARWPSPVRALGRDSVPAWLRIRHESYRPTPDIRARVPRVRRASPETLTRSTRIRVPLPLDLFVATARHSPTLGPGRMESHLWRVA